MAQHIRVLGHDPQWREMFRKEKERIGCMLQGNAAAIYHIGSTAVPDLAAKPVIDIMVAVRSLDEADSRADDFRAAGYEWLGEYGIPGRRYLRKGGDERTHQVHIFHVSDIHNIVRHLAFRDFLRTHEEERRQYAELKEALAERFPRDIDGYSDGKDMMVRILEARALSWYDDSWDRLYLAAAARKTDRRLTEHVEAGAVAAALMAGSGRIYAGVSIYTACSLGMCAERNAIGSMITEGESTILKLVVVMPGGSTGLPCGACSEMIRQLGCSPLLLLDYETRETAVPGCFAGPWWGARQ